MVSYNISDEKLDLLLQLAEKAEAGMEEFSRKFEMFNEQIMFTGDQAKNLRKVFVKYYHNRILPHYGYLYAKHLWIEFRSERCPLHGSFHSHLLKCGQVGNTWRIACPWNDVVNFDSYLKEKGLLAL